MKRKPIIVVSGYYGFRNFGDEAILTEILRTLGPGVEPVVISQDPEHTSAVHGVRAVSRNSVAERALAIWRADGLVFGGGGLLKEPGRNPAGMGVVLLDILFAQLFGKGAIVYGVGTGKITLRASAVVLSRVLGDVDEVILRDATSLARLSTIGVPAVKLRRGGDVLFGAYRGGIAPERCGSRPSGVRVIGVSLSANDLHWMDQAQPGGLQALLDGLRLALAEMSRFGELRLRLIGFQGGGGRTDLHLLETFVKSLKVPLEWESFDLSTASHSRVVEIFQSCDFVLAMRFHAVVLACIAGVPFLAVGWDEKVRSLLTDMDLTDWVFDLTHLKAQRLASAAGMAVSRGPELLERLAVEVPRQHRRCVAAEDLLRGWASGLMTERKSSVKRRLRALRTVVFTGWRALTWKLGLA